MQPQNQQPATVRFIAPDKAANAKPSKAQLAILQLAYERLENHLQALENALNRGMTGTGFVNGLSVYAMRDKNGGALYFEGEGLNKRSLKAVIEAGWLTPALSHGTFEISDAGLAVLGKTRPTISVTKPKFRPFDKVESTVTGRLYTVNDVHLEDSPEGRRQVYVLKGAFGGTVQVTATEADFLRHYEPDERI